MAFDLAARFGAQFAHQRVQHAQHVEKVARLRRLVRYRLDKRLAAVLDRGESVADDEDAERGSAYDHELEGWHQHLEVAAERGVTPRSRCRRQSPVRLRNSLKPPRVAAETEDGRTILRETDSAPSVSNKPERHKSRRASRETARSIRGVLQQNGLYVALSAQVALERGWKRSRRTSPI